MKKRIMFIVGALAVIGNAPANVGVFNGSGQTPIVEKTDAIQMVEEEVVMTPRKARGPVTTGCANLDPMDYRCTFKLRNLKDEPVELQVGFPLDIESYRMPGTAADDAGKLVERFNFTARCGGEKFNVRFVPEDVEKRFSKLFLWTMKFAAKEERVLVVSYTMEGYFGLYHTFASRNKRDAKAAMRNIDIDGGLLKMFATGIGEVHMYVTGTGSCWAGEIEKATFKYYAQDFEAYLARRGAYDETRNERRKRLQALKKRSASAKNLLKPDCRMVRSWNPPPDKWTRIDDDDGRFHYELQMAPFRPAADDSIVMGYVAPPMPTEAGDVDLVEGLVRKFVESRGGDEKQYLRDAKDVVLEFYGVKTGNERIMPFVKTQCWHGQPAHTPPDEKLMTLLKK